MFVAQGLSPPHEEVLNNPQCHHSSVIFMKCPSVFGAVLNAVLSKANTLRLEVSSLEIFRASNTASILVYTTRERDLKSMF